MPRETRHRNRSPSSSSSEDDSLVSWIPGDKIEVEPLAYYLRYFVDARATIKPSESPRKDGRQGYIITARSTLNLEQVREIMEDSSRWRREKRSEDYEDGPYSYSQSDTARRRDKKGAATNQPPPQTIKKRRPTRDDTTREPNLREANPRESNPRDYNPRDNDQRDNNPRDYNPRSNNPRLDVNPRDLNPRDVNPRDADPRDINPRDDDLRYTTTRTGPSTQTVQGRNRHDTGLADGPSVRPEPPPYSPPPQRPGAGGQPHPNSFLDRSAGVQMYPSDFSDSYKDNSLERNLEELRISNTELGQRLQSNSVSAQRIQGMTISAQREKGMNISSQRDQGQREQPQRNVRHETKPESKSSIPTRRERTQSDREREREFGR